ncbi:MAG: glycosyltransferase family 4 protein [Candidatus Eisenbacteria bacterium]|jgi:glycosyltransferase involved in cell wall biosynthesis|nr:glycosyltransferase family 4 protein [Candidatus Eisenbacteria bacterium]
MKLGIDIRWLHEALINVPLFAAEADDLQVPGPSGAQSGNLGGVGRYLDELLPLLASRLHEAECLFCVLEDQAIPAHMADVWPRARMVGLPARWRPQGNALGLLANVAAWRVRRASSRTLAPLGLDVFLSPQQLVVPGTAWARHHAVVCHDLAFLQRPDLFFRSGTVPPSYRAHYRALARAEQLIAVSERTATTLVEMLGVDPERITVTLEGINSAFTPDGPAFAPGWPYAMCAGSAGPGKNVPVVVEGWVRARRHGEPLRLLLAGAPRERVRELAAGCAPGDAAAIHRVAAPGDAQLAALYRGASMLLIPSLVEGFGLPALEAMACGCPVITAHGTPMADMVGAAALVVAPDRPDELRDAIVRLSGDDALRRRLIDAGRLAVAGYTWERTADLTAATIRSLAARPGRFTQ